MDEHKRPESFQTMVKTALKNYTVSVKTGMAPNYGSSHVYGTSQDFRLGVVGHRHDRLKNADLDELRIVIKSILIEIKNGVLSFYSQNVGLSQPNHFVLTAVSPLAEGVDRLFAEQALDLSFNLLCVMPFAQSEYENDFSPDNALEDNSLSRFHDILNRAKNDSKLICYELDGNRENEKSAYKEAGDVVLSRSDILTVVWDGQHKGLIGGTEETFSQALAKGTPVILIDANSPHTFQIPISPQSSTIRNQNFLAKGSGTFKKIETLVKKVLIKKSAGITDKTDYQTAK